MIAMNEVRYERKKRVITLKAAVKNKIIQKVIKNELFGEKIDTIKPIHLSVYLFQVD